MAVVTVGCPSHTDAVWGAKNNVLRKNDIKNLNEGELLGIFFAKKEEFCVQQRIKMSLETKTTRRKLREQKPTTRTSEYSGKLEEAKKCDARMRQKREKVG